MTVTTRRGMRTSITTREDTEPPRHCARGFEQMKANDSGPILYVGRMADRPVGRQSIPQFEIHFPASARSGVMRIIQGSACARWSIR